MKKLFSFLIFILFFFACQTDHRVPESFHPWFYAEKVTGRIWRVSDNGLDNIYLVKGTDSVMVIDSGVGAVDLPGYLSRFINLPIIVVNTHGHPDHVGSNNQFYSVQAHPADFESIQHFTQREVQKQMLQFVSTTPINDSLKFQDTLNVARMIPIQEGKVFNLGGVSVEVIHTPGHTAGSICLLVEGERVLFSGDHIKSEVWLHMPNSTSVEDYRKSLLKIQDRMDEFDVILAGHDSTFQKSLLSELVLCAENIISGTCAGTSYETVVGTGLACQERSAKIVYRTP